MHKWKIKIILNSGKVLEVYYKCNQLHPNYVFDEILDKDSTSYTGFTNEDETEYIYIKKNEIASIIIFE